MDNITIKLGELKRIESSINKLLSLRLPIKVSYSLGKVLKKVTKELGNIEDERNRLIKLYGEEREGEAGQIEIKDPEKQKQFFADMTALFDEEVEFNFRPIDINILDIQDSSGKAVLSDLTPADMINLSEFFYLEEEPEEEEDLQQALDEVVAETAEEEAAGKVSDLSKKRSK